jgi:hypothetical protein
MMPIPPSRHCAEQSAHAPASRPTCRPSAKARRRRRYALENGFGLFAPGATPAPVVAKLNAAVVQALQNPELAKR